MARGISTIFLPKSLEKLCGRLKILLLEKQTGNNCDEFDAEIVAIADELLECKGILTEQHKFSLVLYLN